MGLFVSPPSDASKQSRLRPTVATHMRRNDSRNLTPRLTPDGVIERTKAGVARGLRVGVLFGAISFLLNVLTGGAAYRHFGSSPVSAAVMYVLSGVLGGGIVGALRPMIRNVYSAATVAMLAFLPLVVIVRLTIYGNGGWSVGEALAALAMALFMGGIWGPPIWRVWMKSKGLEY